MMREKVKGRANWHAKATGMKAKERERRKRKMWQGRLIRSRMCLVREGDERGGERKGERSKREILSLRVGQFKMDMLISHGVGRRRAQLRSL